MKKGLRQTPLMSALSDAQDRVSTCCQAIAKLNDIHIIPSGRNQSFCVAESSAGSILLQAEEKMGLIIERNVPLMHLLAPSCMQRKPSCMR